MFCYCLRVVVCVGVVVTYISPVPLLPSSSPCPWLFRPQRICPPCPCRGCRRQLALRASRWATTTMRTPRASLIFQWAERPKHQLHHGVFVVLVVPTCLCHCRHRCRSLEMPLSKSVCCNLQEIARVLSRFCIGSIFVDVLRHNTVAVVALPIFPPNELRRH